MTSIVLAMITRDSVEKGRAGILGKVLASSLQVPYKTMIVVDDSSTNKTSNFIEDFAEKEGKEVMIMPSKIYGGVSKPTRATARQTAIDVFLESFNSEWLFFLDDDAVLNPGWWGEAENHVKDDDVGEIWGISWDASPERKKILQALRMDYEKYIIESFQRRGGCQDTLYRGKALEGIRIPPELHIYEDAWIHRYIQCRGWETRIVKLGVTHYPVGTSYKLRELRERWGQAVEVAVRYGIIEYPISSMIGGRLRVNRLKAYLGLLRPILGAPLIFMVLAKALGLKTALRDTFAIQYGKLWLRYNVLKALKRAGRIRDVCDSINT
jgi:glycosyltransferase involved in cell wall biosynthesis